MLELLRKKGFIPFIFVAFVNAFVDLGHKIIIQNTLFKTFDGHEQILLTAAVNALILLPFVLLLSPAGFLADRFQKTQVMRWSARAAVVITLLITASYYLGWFWLAFTLTLVLALQSALYSPAKYGFIRDLLGKEQLSEGNSWLQSATMIAILAGIVVFSLLFELRLAALSQLPDNPASVLKSIAPLGWLLVLGALCEAIAAERLPQVSTDVTPRAFDWVAYRKGILLKRNVTTILRNQAIFRSVLGLAVFWTISQVMLAVYPSFVEQHLQQTNTFLIQGAMALAGVGIMCGSALAGIYSRHHINTGLIPLGAVGVAVGLMLLPYASGLGWAAGLFFLIGTSGALMVIPLNALIQFHADARSMGRVLAANNFLQNIAMLSGLLLTMLASLLSWQDIHLLWVLVALSSLTAVVATVLLPEAFIRVLASWIMRRRYRLDVQGIEHLLPDGQGMLLLGNHISWLDWAMVQMACPRHIHFVMERSFYERWYLKWFLDLFGVIPISSGHSRQALQQVSQLLNDGKVVCLFPEGAISHTGQLGEFKKGFERAVQGTNARIVPFYLHGLWGSRFSRSGKPMLHHRLRGFKRDIIVAFGCSLPATSDASQVKRSVRALSTLAWQAHCQQLPTLPEAISWQLLSTQQPWLLADVKGQHWSGRHVWLTAWRISRSLRRYSGQCVGVDLPPCALSSCVQLGVWMAGKTLVPLSDDTASWASQVKDAEVAVIVTNRACLSSDLEQHLDSPVPVQRVETLLDPSPTWRTFGIALTYILPKRLLAKLAAWDSRSEQSAVVLFKTASVEGVSGIELSHRQLLGNAYQAADMLNMREEERWLALLPISHPQSVTMELLLPLVAGVSCVYLSRVEQALAIARAVARYRITLTSIAEPMLEALLVDDKVHPLMLQTLRGVLADGQVAASELPINFERHFHVAVYPLLGVPEVAPVVCANMPDHLDADWWLIQQGQRFGSVGMPLPGNAVKVMSDQGDELQAHEVGELWLASGHLLQGYLTASKPHRVQQEEGILWFKSGLTGYLDQDGFLFVEKRRG